MWLVLLLTATQVTHRASRLGADAAGYAHPCCLAHTRHAAPSRRQISDRQHAPDADRPQAELFFLLHLSLAREKIGRRRDAGFIMRLPRGLCPLCGRSTNPCKQGFLSSVLVSSFPNRKLNLRFGFFLCKSATTSQARSLCHYWYASSPGRGALGFSVFLSSISPSLRFCGKTPAAARRAGRGRRLRRAGPRRR